MRRTVPLVAAVALVLAGLLVVGRAVNVGRTVARLTGQDAGAQGDSLPDQHQDSARVAEIRSLRLQRTGSVTVTLVSLRPGVASGGAGGDSATVRWVVQAPDDPVEDADLRGYLDGSVRYHFNQGTSYHMRVGRRWESPLGGRFELKRSLVRFPVPAVPGVGRVAGARVVLWTEAFYFRAPLAGPLAPALPLHLFAYPVEPVWGAGSGGVGRDDFSEPAPGEVSWLDARAGELPWGTPGVLEPDPEDGSGYSSDAVAMAAITGGDRPLTLEGAGLTSFVEERRALGTVDLLLKLEDPEEDRPGTELSFLSSNFGDARDLRPKRPRLEIDARLPCPCETITRAFVLEAGSTVELPPVDLPGGPTLVAVELSGAGGAVPAEVFVRGGEGDGRDPDGPWSLHRNPVERSWGWMQVRLSSAVNRLEWGDTLSLHLKETWVRPGPRSRQVPEAVLVSPSGRTLRVRGEPTDSLGYRIRYAPDEIGLWRYGWSFRPTVVRRPGSHEGEGVTWVALPSERARTERFVQRLRVLEDSLGSDHPLVQSNLNALSRWIGRAAPEERAQRRELLDRLLPGR